MLDRHSSPPDKELIENVLHYGYYPHGDETGFPEGIERAVTRPPLKLGEQGLVKRGIQAFERSVAELVSQTADDATHVIPLSGGLDSRALLAALYHNPDISPSQIQTVTFGTPGTWDFEIGQRVAREMDVPNRTIDLTSSQFDWSWKSLIEYGKDRRPNKLLEGYINSKVPEYFEEKSVYWSGFMGDPTAGAHQPEQPLESWEAAREDFATWNKEPNERLTPSSYDPTGILPDEPLLSREYLSYEEQLDFAIRQQYFIRPVVQPLPYEYLTPFLQDEWLSFVLRLPSHHRANRRLFKKMMTQAYPRLFTLPTDARYGLPLSTPDWRVQPTRALIHLADKASSLFGLQYVPPWTNYIDFETAFRQQDGLREIVDEAVKTFDSRKITDYVDAGALWKAHQAGEDYAAELGIVVSLELYLRTH